MSTYVICSDCGAMLEQYIDGRDYEERYEVCDRCERDRYEVAARVVAIAEEAKPPKDGEP